jgi:cytidine deaminase
MSETGQSVVSVTALELVPGKEAEFLGFAGRLQALIQQKGYGTDQLLRDGADANRYYDIRVWTNAEAAARARTDPDVLALWSRISSHLKTSPIVDLAWAVEVGLAAAGPWQERRALRDRRRGTGERRLRDVGRSDGERRMDIDRRTAFRRAEEEHTSLVMAARIVRERAHAPFSRFKVGAALETTDGRIITGCSVENASYGLTICAERLAVFKAISEGHRGFKRIAVVADSEQPTPPCGACRQILWEFGGNVEVILADLREIRGRYWLATLLPLPFDARCLNEAGTP